MADALLTRSENNLDVADLLSVGSLAQRYTGPIVRLIGLDPAESFGWAYWDIRGADSTPMLVAANSGTWKLTPPKVAKTAKGGYRYSQVYDRLERLIVRDTVVFYEKAMRHAGTAAAHAAGGYYAVIQQCCYNNVAQARTAPVKTVKKFATDNGNASKDDMVAAVNSILSVDEKPLSGTEHDRADAIAVMCWGLSQL